jgi:hypothetical protein
MAGIKFFKDTGSQRKDSLEISKSKILFVEGQDECLFLDHLLSCLGANPTEIEIIPYNGKDKFEANLDAMLKQHYFLDGDVAALAVFQDADGDFALTQGSLVAKMNAQGLPETPLANFRSGDKFGGLRYGAYIFPDNALVGNLETLLMNTIAGKPQAIDAVEYVDKHISAGDKDTSKRKAQAYLAVQSNICRGAGRGARDGYFDLSDNSIQRLRDFLALLMLL